jgi:opacity protein-like surface antigen
MAYRCRLIARLLLLNYNGAGIRGKIATERFNIGLQRLSQAAWNPYCSATIAVVWGRNHAFQICEFVGCGVQPRRRAGRFGCRHADQSANRQSAGCCAIQLDWLAFKVAISLAARHHMIRLAVMIGRPISISMDFLGGGTLGCNYQMNSWVFGIEGDGSWGSVKGSSIDLQNTRDYNTVLEKRWLATARARVGYAWDRTLFYVTGGGAWAGAKFSFPCHTGAIAGCLLYTTSKTVSGWTIGAGLEYGLTNNWTVKGEWLYVDFGTPSFTAACRRGY